MRTPNKAECSMFCSADRWLFTLKTPQKLNNKSLVKIGGDFVYTVSTLKKAIFLKCCCIDYLQCSLDGVYVESATYEIVLNQFKFV